MGREPEPRPRPNAGSDSICAPRSRAALPRGGTAALGPHGRRALGPRAAAWEARSPCAPWNTGPIDREERARSRCPRSRPVMSKRVLFVCTGNSCRSQMAEGLLRHLGKGQVESFSAGTVPRPIHPLAIRAMSDIGIDISTHRSKGTEAFAGQQFDFVITVCDRAKEQCPAGRARSSTSTGRSTIQPPSWAARRSARARSERRETNRYTLPLDAQPHRAPHRMASACRARRRSASRSVSGRPSKHPGGVRHQEHARRLAQPGSSGGCFLEQQEGGQERHPEQVHHPEHE